MKCEKILVPVDFSEDSDRALDYAINLGLQLEAVLILVHVIHVHLPRTAETSFPNIMDHIRKEADEHVKTRRQRAKDAGMRAASIVEPGLPSAKIVEVARDEQVDLVVMGTHGRTGLHHLLLGSVAERVVRLSPCPVLTMPRADAPK